MVLFDHGFPRKRLSGQAVWLGSWVVITSIAAVLKPDPSHHGTHMQLGLPPCPSVLLFHRPCPGCGLTTSWTAFVHGQFAESFNAHPLGPFLYLLFTVTALMSGYGWLTLKRLRSDSRAANVGMMGVMVLVLGYGAIRFSTTVYQVPASYSFYSWSRLSEQSGQATRVPKQDAALDTARPSQVK